MAVSELRDSKCPTCGVSWGERSPIRESASTRILCLPGPEIGIAEIWNLRCPCGAAVEFIYSFEPS